jgi:hypothetical protein
VQRLDHGRGVQALAVAQDLAQVGKGLLRAAQDRVLAREDLHHHHRVEPLGGQDAAGALEVHVRRLARQHV